MSLSSAFFIGIEWIERDSSSEDTRRYSRYRKNALIAARRALRVFGPLPRSVSR